jgi:hypothetical protein
MYKYLILLLMVSCKKQDCIEHAICNDERLEFGIKCDVCKDVGIKYYFDCNNKIIVGC